MGPQKADLFKKELNIFTFGDLLEHFPFRHVDRTKINFIKDINPQMDFVQVAVVIVSLEVIGQMRGLYPHCRSAIVHLP